MQRTLKGQKVMTELEIKVSVPIVDQKLNYLSYFKMSNRSSGRCELVTPVPDRMFNLEHRNYETLHNVH